MPPSSPSPSSAPVALPLARRQLLDWQERLAAFQAPLWLEAEPPAERMETAEPGGLPRGSREAEQPSLFTPAEGLGGPPPEEDPAARARSLRPLALPAQNLAFWRWPRAPHQGPALYFVLDRPAHLRQPLLLYVGETARADRRWKGAHDCKSYLAAYQEALARTELEALLTIRFCCDAPLATGARRALEQALIQRWKPPFNKETRGRWSTPFTADLD
ncbi:MAG: GIY-YIG nuclease family protein [Cyanobacteria bacterium K_Offshore_surface_m2_239]|nr:GIY-YIG nuclease family protein [Cyanobacteria bacterium K_Offshore_surface_m2_239]